MKFSIIIPSFNRAFLIAETLRSIESQSYSNWECIVVDDGSTDNTREVVQNLSKKDARIHYIYQKNAERSAARNNGMRNATGRYICFLDSDDNYAPNYLERLHIFLQTLHFPVGLVVTDFCIWDGNKTIPVKVPPFTENISEWLFANPVSPSRACIHTEIAQKFQFREDIVMVEDSVLWVSIATKFNVFHLTECLIWYRVHEGNSVNRATRAAFSRHDGLLKFFNSPLSNAISSAMKNELLSDVRFRMAEYYQLKGMSFKALQTIVWSFFTSPFNIYWKAKLFFVLQLLPGFTMLWQLDVFSKLKKQNCDCQQYQDLNKN